MKKFINLALASIVGSALTIGVFVFTGIGNNRTPFITSVNSIPSTNAVYTVNENGQLAPLEFTSVSKNVMDAVVHIKVSKKMSGSDYYMQQQLPFDDDFFKFFFGEPQQRQRVQPKDAPVVRGSGSGVIINPDG